MLQGPDAQHQLGGLASAGLPSQPLAPGVGLRFISREGGRVLVECSNGWRTWVEAAAVGQAMQSATGVMTEPATLSSMGVT